MSDIWSYDPASPPKWPKAYRIAIPKIGIDAPVIQYTGEDAPVPDGFNQSVVQHPHGNPMVSMFSAHDGSYDADAVTFEGIDQLDQGDEVIVTTERGKSIFITGGMFLMRPETWTGILMPTRPSLCLYTCFPLGVESHRIVVTARLLKTGIENLNTNALAPAGLIKGYQSAYNDPGGGNILLIGSGADPRRGPKYDTQHDYTYHKPRYQTSGGGTGGGGGEGGSAAEISQAVGEAVAPMEAQTQRVAAQNDAQQRLAVAAAVAQTNAANANSDAEIAMLASIRDAVQRLATAEEMYSAFKNAGQMNV